MKIMSFNTRIWWRDDNWRERMHKMQTMLELESPDIICFQEMLFPATRYIPKKYHHVGCINISHPIYVKSNLKVTKHRIATHYESCVINNTLQIINVHGHWNEKVTKKLIEDVNRLVKSGNAETDIACGDWNVGLNTIKANNIELCSVREALHLPEQDTFQNWKNPSSHGEIDHFLVNEVNKDMYDYRILNSDFYDIDKISDHRPIILQW